MHAAVKVVCHDQAKELEEASDIASKCNGGTAVCRLIIRMAQGAVRQVALHVQDHQSTGSWSSSV